jgi:hypothetical protein
VAARGSALSLDRVQSAVFNTDFSGLLVNGFAEPCSLVHLRSDSPQTATGMLWLHNSRFPPLSQNAGAAHIVLASSSMIMYSSDDSAVVMIEGADLHTSPWRVQKPTGDALPRLQLQHTTFWNLTREHVLVRHMLTAQC